MITRSQNLKDTSNELDIVIKDKPTQLAYTKTNKLIIALYMVTDIIDKDEPLRNKLRTLGNEIISDINFIPSNARNKINQIMSFLDIASSINIISGMNANILKKEFLELDKSIAGLNNNYNTNTQLDLSEFFERENTSLEVPKNYLIKHEGYKSSIGHHDSTSIGVQKGSTLMQALSEKTRVLSQNNLMSVSNNFSKNNFDDLKIQRRNNIINIIKNNGGNATIKDIRNKINIGLKETFISSEKTIQRELLSMIKDNVLYKTGEKRWSRYFIK